MPASSVLAKMAVEISANNSKFAAAMSKSQRDLSSFTSGVQKIAGALGVAFSINQVASFGIEIAKLAGQADGVRAAFERLPDSTRLMDQLKKATGGTVSELALMKRAVQASNFDIELSQLPKLLEFATLRAQQTGQSVDYLVDSIVTGIGRKSKLILDNLGISAVQLTEALGGASAMSSSIADVTKAVGFIADKNLQNMAKFSENASTKAERLAATWENVKVALGNETKGAVGGFYDLANGILTDINAALTNQVTLLQREQTGLNTLVGAITDTVEGETARKFLLQELNSKYPQFLKNLDIEKVTNEQLAARLKDVNAQFERKILLAAAEGRQKETADAILDTIDEEVKARKALVATQQAMAKEQGYNVILAIQAEAQEAKIANLIEKRAGLQAELTSSLKAYDAALGVFESNTSDYFDKTTKSAQTLTSAVEQLSQTAQRALAGTSVTGTTTGSFGTIPGVDTNSMFSQMEEFRNKNAEVTQEVSENWIDMSGIVGGAVSSLAEGLGNAIVGVEDFGSAVITAFANFAKQFGEMLIASGIAAIGLEKLIENPAAAIAAGVALVAIAGAASASLSKAHSGLTGGGSSGGNTRREAIGVEVEGRISGYTIALNQKKEGYRRGIMG